MRNMLTQTSAKHQRLQQQNDTWSPPPPHTYKINWDATIDKMKCKVGIRIIVRDHSGLVVASSRLNISLYPEPFLAEAIGALEASRLGNHLGLTKIILEGDSFQVIQAINGKGKNWSSTGMIIDDIKGQLSTLESWSAIHICREGNKATHVLAKNAFVNSTSSLDVDSIPSCITNFI
ncbi:hypothetical protein F2P56_002592 [Juglans regia]|uniref:RNase H type-1 domain-containing protein n=2 Tax=Juglans regia TaxID=51240 RepID=A0A833YF04_JUGRE|nr:uncharacterized protein LOC108986402 [Juglans regia]KAF5481987.1 hypothetical protein F2P56_002592 [Juglans regia]